MATPIAELLKDSLLFFRKNIYEISLLVLPCIIPLEILNSVAAIHFEDSLQGPWSWWIVMLPNILVYPLYQGALIFYMAGLLAGTLPTPSQCYRMSVSVWRQLLMVYMIGSIMVMIGFILLILPGFIVMGRIAFSEFFCALQNRGAMESISDSWKTTKPYQVTLIKGLLLIIAPLSIADFAIEHLLVRLNLYNIGTASLLGTLASVLLSISLIFAFRMYCLYQDDLKESTGSEALPSD